MLHCLSDKVQHGRVITAVKLIILCLAIWTNNASQDLTAKEEELMHYMSYLSEIPSLPTLRFLKGKTQSAKWNDSKKTFELFRDIPNDSLVRFEELAFQRVKLLQTDIELNASLLRKWRLDSPKISEGKTEHLKRVLDDAFLDYEKLLLLNRFLFNVPSDEQLGKNPLFSGYTAFTVSNNRLNRLYPLRLSNGELEFIEETHKLDGIPTQPEKEVSFFSKHYSRRKK